MAEKSGQRVIFDSGVDTAIEDVLTPNGGLSTSQNTRQRHPGIEQRSGNRNVWGLASLVGDNTDEMWRIFQYIDRNSAKHFLRQTGDGGIDVSDNAPPTTITAWTEKLAAQSAAIVAASMVPASFNVVDSSLIVSDGTRQHQIYSGATAKVKAFLSYKGAGEITGAVYGGTLNVGLNDLTSGGTYTGTASIPRYYKVSITTAAGTDLFDWWYSTDNRVTWNVGAADVSVTGAAQTLDNGVTVTITATTGHTTANTWYFEAHAIDVIPAEGEDYTFAVNDKRADTYAEIDSLGILTAHDAIFICTEIPASKLTMTFVTGTTNDNASVLAMHYWKDTSGSYGWTAVSSLSDGTDVSGDSFKQDGSITWTASPSNEVPHYMFGRNGFWYRLTFSAALDADVQIKECSYESTYQQIQNIWNGVPDIPAEVIVEKAGNDISKMSTKVLASSSVPLYKFPAGDYVYVHSIDKLVGFYIDPGSTPNIISAKAVGLQTKDGSADEDTLSSPKRLFSREGFAEGMDVVTAGFSDGGNNVTFNIRSVSSSTIKAATATFTVEATDADATVTYEQESYVSAVEYWSGNSWVAVSNMVDGTRGLSQHGFITWQRNSAHKSQFKQSIFHSYVYRFKMNSEILANINFSIETLPYFDINDLSYGVCNGAWKQRAVYSNGNQYAYITSKGSPMILNGSDFAVMEAGDGRSNKIVAFRTFYNEMITWQEEDSVNGGCTTLFEGFSPQTFGKVVLSTEIGCLNSKSAVVIDGSTAFVSTKDRVQTIAIWLSRYGVYMTDGRVVTNISRQIHNYFNPLKSTCININYKKYMWLDFDSGERVVRIGLVTGTNTKVNIFPVLDVDTFQWSFDTFPSGAEPGCFTEVVPATFDSVNPPLIQLTGGANDATIKQNNYGLNDSNATNVAQAISCRADVEFDGQGGRITMHSIYLREKAQDGTTMVEIKKSTNTNEASVKSLARVARQKSDQHHRSEFNNLEIVSDHITVSFKNTEKSSSMYLLDSTFITETDDGYSR